MYKQIFNLSLQFEKLAQQMQTSSQESGAYEDVLEKANIWFDDNSIYNLLDKYDINLINLSVTILPNLNVKINVTGKHPKLSLFSQDIQQAIGVKMINALKSALLNKKITQPEKPITLMWKTNFGYK